MAVIAPSPKEMNTIGRRAVGNLFSGSACCIKKYLKAPFIFKKISTIIGTDHEKKLSRRLTNK